MYDLPYHKERRSEVIKSFIETHPFAVLTGCDPQGRPVITQVPLFLEEADGHTVLRGHIMRKTDHHKAFLHNENVLAVFTGPQAYVSATWYSDPYVPSTWNYMSVHVRGTIRFLDGATLEDMLQQTSLHFEAYDRDSPTVYENLPAEHTPKLIKMIAAFEIAVEEIDTVFKLSQDRDASSYRNIIEQLRKQGDDGREIAAEMEKRMEQVFSGK